VLLFFLKEARHFAPLGLRRRAAIARVEFSESYFLFIKGGIAYLYVPYM
jgi:hypothetical protein